MNKKIRLGKKVTAVLIIFFVFAAISALYLLGVFDSLEYVSYDIRVRFWADSNQSRASDEIFLITIDDNSVLWAQQERGWGWPWPRQAYAEIIEYFNIANVNSIAFDILFTEPSVFRDANQDEIIDDAITTLQELEDSGYFEVRNVNQPRVRSEEETAASRTQSGNRQTVLRVLDTLRSLSAKQDDNKFIQKSAESGKVVQAVIFSNQNEYDMESKTLFNLEITENWPPDYNVPLFNLEGFDPILKKFSVGETEKGQFPIPGLVQSAAALGSVTSAPDSDGIYRRLKLFTLFDGKAVPGLSAASLLVSGMEPFLIYDKKNNSLQWEHISIPVNKEGSALLKFRGDLIKYVPYSASSILQSLELIKKGEEPLLNPSYFTDSYIFVGVYGQGFFDIFATPISSIYPGVGAHITMMDNLLNGDFIKESSHIVNLLILLCAIILIVFLSMFSHKITVSLTGMITAIIAVIFGAFAAYQFGNLWLPIVIYLAGILASFVTVTLYNFATEGSQKRFIKSAFSQYLSPKVIEQIIQDPSQLKLGGEKREMTAIFTDVRGFSTFSEALGDPTKLVELLNFYLTKMSNIVLDNQGTIDKYEGDAIIAFFGAPIHYENHASLACRAVIEMKKAEPEINREAIETGLVTPKVMEAMFKKGLTKSLEDPCQIFTRIGMNTGDMVVGNMGTPNKMDYTIMGNAVNLAARLEGVNKQYNTGGILISEYTKDHLSASGHGDEFIIRPLSRVRVVGINTPLRLYELLDTAKDATPGILEMVKMWTQAFGLYEQKDFSGAADQFGIICRNYPDDMAAKKYLLRCTKYIDNPPDDKTWDNGVDNLTEK